MSIPIQLAGKVRSVKKSPIRHTKKKSEFDDNYNPYKKRNTALREIPRTSLRPDLIQGDQRSKSTMRANEEKETYLQDAQIMDEENDNNVYIKELKNGNSNILVSVRARPVNKKEMKYAKEKGLAEKCIKILDEKI